MGAYEVSFEVITKIRADSKEDAIKKFMEENNVDDVLKIYITAEDITVEELQGGETVNTP